LSSGFAAGAWTVSLYEYNNSNNCINDGSGTANKSTFDQKTVTVTRKTLTGAFTANNKVYDGTTAATIGSRTLSGVLGTDDVNLSGGSATFANRTVAIGKTVTGTGFTLSGTAASNYTLASSTLTTTANISTKALVVSATGVNRTYDGTASATVTLSDDRISG